MLETERYDSVCLIISHNDFEGKDHQSIFKSMGELVENNKPLDPFTLSDKLDSRNLLQSTGGRDYLVELAQTSPTAANLEAYAELIRERSIRRKLQRINSEISELITNPQGRDSGGLLDEAESKIFALNDEASRTSNKIRSLEELIPLSIDMLNELSQKGPSLIGSSTGFKALDEKTYDLKKGMCTISDEEKVLGLGGIMGGESTGCNFDTINVLLESALFDNINTARTGRDLSILSDARYRFERGVDPRSTLEGIHYATQLILEICGGECSEIVLAG